MSCTVDTGNVMHDVDGMRYWDQLMSIRSYRMRYIITSLLMRRLSASVDHWKF